MNEYPSNEYPCTGCKEPDSAESWGWCEVCSMIVGATTYAKGSA